MKKKWTISGRFQKQMQDKRELLLELREVARLVDPTLLLREYRKPDDATAMTYQSDGARLAAGLTGRILSSVLPPGDIFAKTIPSEESLQSGAMTPDVLDQLEASLWMRDVQTLAALESAGGIGGNDSVMGIHAKARNVIEQLIVLGDVLIRQDYDYGLTVFNPDHYTVLRNDRGEVLCYTCREGIDLLSLCSENDQGRKYDVASIVKAARCKSVDELADAEIENRLGWLFTSYEWQPLTRKWLIRQEVSGDKEGGADFRVFEDQHEVPSHWSVFWKLSNANNYGTGLGTLCRSDLKMMDTLSLRVDEFAETLSKIIWMFDSSDTTFDPKLLERPSGSVIPGDVRDGKAVGVTCLSANRAGDFGPVLTRLENIRSSLGRSFLEAEVRQSERTTALEVSETTIAGLQNALGAVYPNIADGFQRPLWKHTQHLLEKKKKLVALPKGSVRTEFVTGLAALARKAKFQNIVQFQQFLASVGVPLDQVMNIDRYISVASRYIGVIDPGLIKTPEERRKAIEDALRVQAQQQAIQTGIQTAGRIAEQNAAIQARG